MTPLFYNDFVFAIAYALDYSEHTILSGDDSHSERVAWMASRVAVKLGLSPKEQNTLVLVAAVHDNAIPMCEHVVRHLSIESTLENLNDVLVTHCMTGEQNMRTSYGYEAVRNVVLYHHENYDGSGTFHQKGEAIPLMSRIIHVVDDAAIQYDLGHMGPADYRELKENFVKFKGILYAPDVVDAFLLAFPSAESLRWSGDAMRSALRREYPGELIELSPSHVTSLANAIARVIDYKCAAHCTHSREVSKKAGIMADYYGWDEDEKAQFVLAGAIHDIGKLQIDSRILEKPERLSATEYRIMKRHAAYGYQILRDIRGLELIGHWAYMHHEKLDGSGYPFGVGAEDLEFKDRLMACIDIYTALLEDRSYKDVFTHEEAMQELRTQASAGKIDGRIVEDIDLVFGRKEG